MLLGADPRNESSHLNAQLMTEEGTFICKTMLSSNETTKHSLSQQYVMICNFDLTHSSLNRLGTVIKYLGQINR